MDQYMVEKHSVRVKGRLLPTLSLIAIMINRKKKENKIMGKSEKKPRAIIKSVYDNRVQINLITSSCEKTFTLSAPHGGGYVRDGNHNQIFGKATLSGGGRGPALYWDGVTPFIDLVRAQYRRWKRASTMAGE